MKLPMLTELGKRIDANSEHFNKQLEDIKKDPIRNSIAEIKNNTLEGMNSRLSDTEECINDLDDRIMELIQS